MDLEKNFAKLTVTRRKLHKAIVRRIPPFMTDAQFHKGFTSQLEIKFLGTEFKQTTNK